MSLLLDSVFNILMSTVAEISRRGKKCIVADFSNNKMVAEISRRGEKCIVADFITNYGC